MPDQNLPPTDPLRVHISDPPDEAARVDLRARLDDRIRISLGPDLPEEPRYHILVAGRPTSVLIAASEALHTLIIPWAGLPPETRDLMRQHGHIAVHNLHYNAAATAEMALALLLASGKHLVPCDRRLRKGDWSPRYAPNPSMVFEGKAALILGHGAIGSRVARACRSLNMRVLICRRDPFRQSERSFEGVYPPSELMNLLPHAEVLIICLPLTEETDGLIGAEELAAMPEGALLVNVSRGPIVDQEALFQALQSNKLGAAGIDVWYRYPQDEQGRVETFPSDYPFHELDNVVMSPHRAGGSTESAERRMTALVELLNAAARGDPIPNRVDLRLGY